MTALALDNEPEPAEARFVHLTDIHFWHVVLNPFWLLNKRFIGNANVILRRRHEFLTQQAPMLIEYVASLGVRDVVITGDFTSTANVPEFERARDFVCGIADRGMRPVLFPGNHDVYTFESVRHKRFEKYLGEWLPIHKLPGTARLSSGATVLYVPTVCPNLISSKGMIWDAEIDAVEETVAAATGPLFVAGHYPVLNKTYAYASKPNRRLRGANALGFALREARHPLLYFSGHVHRFSLVRDPISANVTHLTSGALFRRDHVAGHTAEFSEIRRNANGLKVIRHRFQGKWMVTEEPVRDANA